MQSVGIRFQGDGETLSDDGMNTRAPFVWRCRWAALATALFLTCGCNFTKVNNVRLAGVEVVDGSRQVLPDELGQWNPGGRLVKLTFWTEKNIRNVARDLGLHVRVDAYSCGNRDHVLEMLDLLFDHDGAIGDNPTSSSNPDESAVWIYVSERSGPRRDIETGKITIPSYDLAHGKVDLCIRLHGRNMALEGFSSNIVRVPSEALEVALKSP